MWALSRTLAASTALVALPARLAHEATHALFTAPHADTWHLHIHPARGEAAVIVDDWAADAPRWGIVLAHLGPLILGTLLGVAALAWVAAVGYVPESANAWLKVAVLAAYWGIYTAPSGGDLAVLTDEGGG